MNLPYERIVKTMKETGVSLFTALMILDIDPLAYDLDKVRAELSEFQAKKKQTVRI